MLLRVGALEPHGQGGDVGVGGSDVFGHEAVRWQSTPHERAPLDKSQDHRAVRLDVVVEDVRSLHEPTVAKMQRIRKSYVGFTKSL